MSQVEPECCWAGAEAVTGRAEPRAGYEELDCGRLSLVCPR